MILEKYDRNIAYRPLDIFSVDALLYLARDRQWDLKELTPVRMVPLGLSNRYVFHKPYDEPYVTSYSATFSPINAYANYRDMTEEVDLEHIGFNGLYFLHWRVGYRKDAKELIVGYDRNDEYVHFERRDLSRQSR